MKQNLLSRVNNYFFAEDSSLVLKAYRSVLCFYLLLFHNGPSDSLITEAQNLYQPVGIFKLLGPLEDLQSLTWLTWVFRISLGCAGLGLFSNGGLLAVVLSGAYVLAYNYNFGTVGHGTTLIYSCLCFLIFVPKEVWRPGYRGIHAKWPVSFLKCFIVGTYFVAGLHKVLFSGLEWAWSENLALIIYQNKITWLGGVLLDLSPVILRTLALGVLMIELLSPLALAGKRAGYIFIVLWASLHLGIQFTLGNHKSFLSQIPCTLIFCEGCLLFAGERSRLAWGRLKELGNFRRFKIAGDRRN